MKTRHPQSVAQKVFPKYSVIFLAIAKNF